MEEREKEKVKAAAKRIKEQKEAEKAGRKRRKERLAELRPAGYYKAGSAGIQRLHPCACRFAMHQLRRDQST
jgi:hypothetical protein